MRGTTRVYSTSSWYWFGGGSNGCTGEKKSAIVILRKKGWFNIHWGEKVKSSMLGLTKKNLGEGRKI